MFNKGDKVKYLGMCYRITRLADGKAWLQILRKTSGPRCRKAHAELRIDDLKEWKKGRIRWES